MVSHATVIEFSKSMWINAHLIIPKQTEEALKSPKLYRGLPVFHICFCEAWYALRIFTFIHSSQMVMGITMLFCALLLVTAY